MQKNNAEDGVVEADELKNQVENYKTLRITQSRRGQVVLVFTALYVFTIIISFFGFFSLSDVLLGLIIYIPLLIFVYKGHRWAMIVLMILWICEKLYTAYLAVENSVSPISSIIWLFIVLPIIYKALKVENARRKLISPTESASVISGNYCKNCGVKLTNPAKFCSSCGSSL